MEQLDSLSRCKPETAYRERSTVPKLLIPPLKSRLTSGWHGNIGLDVGCLSTPGFDFSHYLIRLAGIACVVHY
jgi:hypothetical protein